ncbi:transcription factor bHLH57 [Euphorbia lathyris]|uniref:transcription factor bHLH57 n=1 Tax=Euphorbia lathyris TaxID=212925 RepID=UPI003313E1C2
MESLQGPIDPSFFGGNHLDVEGCFSGEEEAHFLMSSLEDKIPFLQMLQGVDSDSPQFEPNFQTLLKLQHLQNPWEFNINSYVTETETQAQALELESCVTHDIADLQSPVKSESQDLHNPHSNSCIEGVSPNPSKKRVNFSKESNSGSSSFPWNLPHNQTNFSNSKSSPLVPRERKKRKRARPVKNKEEVESQRMTHIAVERNRRRQMNDHLNSLRSLMPPSYVQRGDQASIIGGAIDFVKELEQLLESLEGERRIRKTEEAESLMGISSNGLFALQPDCNIEIDNSNSEEAAAKVKRKSETAEIEVTAVQNHVNLKIQCKRNQGQLLRAIIALEDLRLTVLHLNISSSDTTALYSFNLKIEEDCKLGSADEVAATVNQIFSNS